MKDGSHKELIKGMEKEIDIEDFRCDRCINEIDLANVYNTIKIY